MAVWINAFLPRDIEGLTLTLPGGPHAGRTAVAGPPHELTDQRGFSSHRQAPARMQSWVGVDFTGPAPVVTQAHRCDPTVVWDPGEAPRSARASRARMRVVVVSLEPAVTLRLEAVAAHPFPSRSPLARDVEYRGEIALDRAARTVRVDLMIQLFPAFEGYASLDDGPPAVLFHHAPPPGASRLRLPAGAQRRIRAGLRDADGDGVLETPVPPGAPLTPAHDGAAPSRG
jgi:hypothetical protein